MANNKNLVSKIISYAFLAILAAGEAKNLSPCTFLAIYNFGDSNSDTSNGILTANQKPTRVLSNGHLIVDFIAQKLGKSYLSAYADKYKTNFRQGANFAVGGSTIRYMTNETGMFLGREISEFCQFKAKANPLPNIGINESKSDYFSRALYTIDIGQNDVTRSMYGGNVKEIPSMIQDLAVGVKKLYDEGARSFWMHNTGPVGCLVGFHNGRPPYMNGALDKFGCLISYNDVAKEFNKQLKNKVVELRSQLKDIAITYVDVYTAKYKLFTNAKSLGFTKPLGICRTANNTCPDPSNYILWEGIHYTEAANRIVAQAILDGALSDPPLAITQACYRDVAV